MWCELIGIGRGGEDDGTFIISYHVVDRHIERCQLISLSQDQFHVAFGDRQWKCKEMQ